MFKSILFKKALLGTAVFSFTLGLAVAGMHEKERKKADAKPNKSKPLSRQVSLRPFLPQLKRQDLKRPLPQSVVLRSLLLLTKPSQKFPGTSWTLF